MANNNYEEVQVDDLQDLEYGFNIDVESDKKQHDQCFCSSDMTEVMAAYKDAKEEW